MRQSELGVYLRDIGKYDLLSAQEEVALARKARSGDARAVEKMTQANLRLVVSVAKRHIKSGIPLHELVAEGNMGLMRAVQKFDPERGTRFSTYAVFWIRRSIQRLIERQRPKSESSASRQLSLDNVALPVQVGEELGQSSVDLEQVKKVLRRLNPREAEILRLHFGLRKGAAALSLGEISKKFGITRERVRQIEERAIRSLKRECRRT